MSYDHEDQKVLNQHHLQSPGKGDYWEDHMVGVLQVLDVVHGIVIFFDQKIQSDKYWEWDVSKPRSLTLEEFKNHLRYKSEGSSTKTWANVHPDREL